MIGKIVNLLYWLITSCLAMAVVSFWVEALPAHRFDELMARNPNMFVDFVKFYTGAKMLLSGQGYHFYDPASQLEWLNRVAPMAGGRELNYMEYTPQMLMLACVFVGWLSLNASYAVWSAATMTIGLLSLLLLRYQVFGRRALLSTVQIGILFTGSAFCIHNMLLGQTGWLNVGLVSLFFLFFLRKRDTICGVILAVSTVKPQLLLLLLPPILARRRWRCLGSGLVSGVVILILAICLVGWSNILEYPHFLFHSESRLSELQVGLRGILSILLPSKIATIISIVLMFIGEAAMTYLWIAADTRNKMHLAVANCCVLYLLFCPHAFLYDCLLLSITVAVLLPEISLGFAWTEKQTYRRVWYTILLTAPPLLVIPYLRPGSAAPLGMLCASLLLLSCGLTRLREELRN